MKRVSKVIKKTNELVESDNRPSSLLSGNKVTGFSVNFPIANTCRPSKVCIETCYYATGGTAWNNSLRKQLWLMNYCRENPSQFAEDIVKEYNKQDLDYLRWNGGGDLFEESVDAVNYIGRNHPNVVLWVVTRKADMAALVENHPNVHLHFSLDAHSLERRDEALSQVQRPIFFSYQCKKGEKPDIVDLTQNHGISLFFFDNYYLTDPIYEKNFIRFLCPLNLNRTNTGDISGSCGSCRKCFNNHWIEEFGNAIDDESLQAWDSWVKKEQRSVLF